MSRLLVSQRALMVPGQWVRDDLWRRARAVPTLDLRFAENKSLADAVTGASLVTFTRAGSGTYVDSAGVIQTASTNAPRFDHNPTTGESLGLMVEEQRTNSIRNNTMVGAVAGTPGTNPTSWLYATAQSNGLTISVIGTGAENGINYIDYRFNGTTIASPSSCAIGFDNGVAATGQIWTQSLYWKLVGGSATGVANWQIGLIESTSGGAFIAGTFYTQTAPTSAALISQRPTATRTLSGGATVGLCSAILNIPVTGNTAIDFTIRIGLPQLEQGAFATSVIPTSTAATTRSADVASITGSAFSSWYRQDEGTLFADFRLNGIASQNKVVNADAGGGFANSVDIYCISGIPRFDVWESSAAQAQLSPLPASSIGVNVDSRTTGAYKLNDFAAARNGGTLVTDTSGIIPTTSRLVIGNQGASNYLNGTIRRLVYWGQRLPNNVLQAITL